MTNADDRDAREQEFHDEWAADIDPDAVDVIGHWEGPACPEVQWIRAQLGDLSGKSVLEIGSGAGEGAVYFALGGASVMATDISTGMLEVVAKVAARYGVEVDTAVASATDLSRFGDGSFDVVYGANVLHHVDIGVCLDEVRRVLAPSGVACFWDPVDYNPAIKLYRQLATEVRTDDEHPLRRGDIKTMESKFADVRFEMFWFSALLIFMRFFAIDRIHPNASRYWKLVVERQDELAPSLRRWHSLDRRILRWIPPARWWCWNVAVALRKPVSGHGDG